MNLQQWTDRSFDIEQAFATMEDAVRRFRTIWARQQSGLMANEADPNLAKDIVAAAIESLKGTADELQKAIDKVLDEVIAEGEAGVTAEPAAAEPEPEHAA